jgi:hypothetical protein
MSNVYQIKTAKPKQWFWVGWLTDPDLQIVVLFCALGLLISLYVMIRYPEFGAIIDQCNQF